jgi:hypothetical protein
MLERAWFRVFYAHVPALGCSGLWCFFGPQNELAAYRAERGFK